MGKNPWVLGLSLGLSGLGAFYRWARGPVYKSGDFAGRVDQLPGSKLVNGRPGDQVRLVSWNVAWGHAWGSEGSGERKGLKEIESNMKAIGQRLRDYDADIVCLQEVDFDAKRSGGVNQARLLAELGGYQYVAEAVTWKCQYVPFPGASPQSHWGPVVAGGAILSRFPMSAHRLRLFDKPKENPFYYNAFYPGRYVQRVVIAHPQADIAVANLHLEAFQRANREEQAAEAQGLFLEPASHRLVVGDFNTVPPSATVCHAYDDEPETDHRGDLTLPRFSMVDGLQLIGDSGSEESEGFTFPSHRPNRRLDHLLAQGFQSQRCWIDAKAGNISDHLPLMCDLKFL